MEDEIVGNWKLHKTQIRRRNLGCNDGSAASDLLAAAYLQYASKYMVRDVENGTIEQIAEECKIRFKQI